MEKDCISSPDEMGFLQKPTLREKRGPSKYEMPDQPERWACATVWIGAEFYREGGF